MDRLPLSLLIDRMHEATGGLDRDEAFVRAFSQWMAEKAPYLSLSVVDRLGLQDVVVTFQMKRRVKLIVTGYPPEELPGEVTLGVDELDFPRVEVVLSEAPRRSPYEICTLDYGPAGRAVRITSGAHQGSEGRVVVAATVGARQELRIALDSGEVVTIDGADVVASSPSE